MKPVKVTIIMPVLNGMPYFKEALDSVRNQTLKEIEILVVDAGSTDGTCKYVTECAKEDGRVKLINSDIRSMGVQYNMGIACASGQYVGFCESDDYIEPNMMEILYNTAKENEMPETVKSDFYLFIRRETEEYNLNYHIIPRYKKSQYGKVISLENNGDIYLRDIYMWYGIYRRDFLIDNKIVLNETPGAAFQDGGYIQQVNMLATRQIYLPMQFYHYRRDNANSSVYKKETSLFSLWEGQYVIDWLNKHQELKEKYCCLMVERMVGQFFIWLYIKDIYHYGAISYSNELGKFRDSLMKLMESMSYPERLRVINNHFVYLLLYDIENLNVWANVVEKMNYEKLCGFRDFVCKKKQLIIVTAGEVGKSICTFLLRNKWEGQIYFCDNNNNLHGKKVMGREVYSMSEAVRMFPDAIYVLHPAFYDELYFQLIYEGVSASQLILPPTVSLFGCTGTDWR